MKSTGVVRQIDSLGRLTLPKEIRRTLRIRVGDPLELFIENNCIIYKKYSPMKQLSDHAQQYADSLSKCSGYAVVVFDTDEVIAAAGTNKKGILGSKISEQMSEIIQNRDTITMCESDTALMPIEGMAKYAVAGSPIIAESDVCGYIMFVSDNIKNSAGEAEIKLIATAANFLGKQMEM